MRFFDIEVGHSHAVRRRRVQGRHPLQTSDALGAAVECRRALTVELHLPLEKTARVLRTRFGLRT